MAPKLDMVYINGTQESVTVDPSFDPYIQPFTLLAPDGKTPMVTSVYYIQQLSVNIAYQGIIYGTQVGACVLMCIMLLLMTKPDKRRSWVFLFNVASLVLGSFRPALQCAQLSGAFYNFYNYQAQWYDTPSIGRAKALSISAGVFTTLMIICIEASLVIQVRIVCVTAGRLQRVIVTIAGFIVAAVAIGFRVALFIINTQEAINIGKSSVSAMERLNWTASCSNITLTTSIAYFSIVFCTKLALAIRSRQKMGLKQFGPMQIIFIMGCQTLIVPLFFAVITYYAIPNSQINSFVATVVAIFLPLSGMWASASINRHSTGRRGRIIPYGADSDPEHCGGLFTPQHSPAFAVETAETLVGGNSSSATCSSPLKLSNLDRRSTNKRSSATSNFNTDLDMSAEDRDKSITIGRSYSVKSDHDLIR